MKWIIAFLLTITGCFLPAQGTKEIRPAPNSIVRVQDLGVGHSFKAVFEDGSKGANLVKFDFSTKDAPADTIVKLEISNDNGEFIRGYGGPILLVQPPSKPCQNQVAILLKSGNVFIVSLVVEPKPK